MTKEEIMELDLDALESRANAIALATDSADMETLETLNAELDAIEERKADIAREIETRKKDIAEVIKGNGTEVEVEERTTKMTDKEIRSSAEYMNAYAEYLKGKATPEQRTLVSEVGGGTVAVPVYVEDRIHTAWENDEILRRIRRTFFPGILKVGYEKSAEGAVIHAENDDPIEEENLELEYVSLVPEMVKKMVRFTDEVMDLKGQAFLDYIFDEIEYQLMHKVAYEAVTRMLQATSNIALAATVTAGGSTLTTLDIINAEGMLGGEATNPVLITTRSAAASLKAAALAANYGYDPFDGLDVLYVEPAVFTQFVGVDVLGIVADLSAVQANFPNGDQPTFKFDDMTEADADLVRVIGRLYMAIGVVAPGKIAVIIGGEEGE